jgi:hypothetical protein
VLQKAIWNSACFFSGDGDSQPHGLFGIKAQGKGGQLHLQGGDSGELAIAPVTLASAIPAFETWPLPTLYA